MTVTFEGEPPFQLPPIQSAQVAALDDTVLLTVNVLIDGRGPSPVPIMMQMTWDAALALAGQLGREALFAKAKSRQS